jgi:PIN domain nuclease of toxin-antitoxin system
VLEARIILDTCALLWLASGDKNLSSNALQQRENASIVNITSAYNLRPFFKPPFFKPELATAKQVL